MPLPPPIPPAQHFCAPPQYGETPLIPPVAGGLLKQAHEHHASVAAFAWNIPIIGGVPVNEVFL
jgi:hypothetical protein